MRTIKLQPYTTGLLLAVFIIAFSASSTLAQIKIGTNGTTIAPASLLELESANQGLLLPRMADTAAINALNPPNGMLIYLTKVPAVGLYVRKVTGWEYLTGSLGGNGNFNSLTVAGTITAGNFSGPLNGNATSANTSLTSTNSLNSAVINDLASGQNTYPTFVTQTPGNAQLRTSTTKLSFVPNTGILTAVGFNGPLVGDVTGNASSATNATNASNTDISDDVSTNAVHYPTFVSGTTGNLPHRTSSTNLSYTPQTGELKAVRFLGNLTGNASSSDNAITTTITNDNISGAVVYPTFVTNTSGNWGQRTAGTKLTFVPASGVLSTSAFASTIPTGTAPLSVASTTTVANLSATNTLNTNITDDVSTAAPVYPTFVTGTSGNLAQRVASSRLSFIPSTGALTASSFVGPLTGNANTATTATNTTITNDISTAAVTYPTFVTNTTGDLGQRTSSTGLNFVPSTGVLTANAFTSTVPTGVAPLVVASTTTVANLGATNTLNTNITEDVATSAPVFPTFVTGTSGNLAQRVASSRLSFIPSTGALTASSFNGPLAGNANTATTATNTTITNDISTAAVTYPTFVTNTTGDLGQRTSSTRLNFVPSTGVLTANAFTSIVPTGVAPLVVASTTTVANLGATNTLNTNITDDVATAGPVYPTFVTGTSGNLNQRVASSRLSFIPSTGALTAASFVGPLNGNATSATSAVNATNSANSTMADDITTATVAYPVFVNGTPGNQPLRTGTTNLSYRPSTGILTAKGFNGPLVGNVTGTATASLDAENTVNIRITDDVISNTPVYPTFVTGTSGPLPPKVSSTKLSFTPSSGELVAPVFRGAFLGNASTATTVTGNVAAVNGGTGQTNFTPGDILYASTSSALSKLAIGAPNSILRVSAGNIPTWSTAGAGTVTSVTGTANKIIVSNGDNTIAPILDIAPTYVGQNSITTVGTITSGVWNGSVVPVASGGTGLATLPTALLVGNGTSPMTTVTGTIGHVLTSTGPTTPPVFQASGGGDMIIATPQTVTGTKTFNSGSLLLNGTGAGTISLVTTSPTIGIANFPSGTYDVVTTNTAQTLSGPKTLASPAFTGTATFDIASGTSVTTTGNISATGGFIGNLTGNVTGNASTATNFTGALVGDVTGNQTTTVVAQVGGQTAANIATGVIRANTATAVAGNSTLVSRDINGDFSADQITATQGFVGNLTGNASTVTTIPTLLGEVTNSGNTITLGNAAVISKLVGATYTTATTPVSATDNIIQAIGKVEGNANLKAPINNPSFTGTVVIPSPYTLGATSVTTTGTQLNYLNIATGVIGTSNVVLSDSPILTGTPTLPTGTIGTTQIAGNNTTALATTAFVTTADALKANIASPTFTGTVTIPTPFTLGATSVTTDGTRLNFLNAASGTTGTTNSNVVFSASPTLTTPILGVATVSSIRGNSTVPTEVDGVGIIASTVLGTNLSGSIEITSNAAGAGNSALLTLTYSGLTFPTNSYPVLVPANPLTAALLDANKIYVIGNPGNFQIMSGTATLPAGTYKWYYMVSGN